MSDRGALGRRGEDLAATFLRDKGYALLDRNWRDGRNGELDIVARHAATVVFVEVKTRRSRRYGTPFEAITPTKMARLRRLAAGWLAAHDERPEHVRLDAIGVLITGGETSIEHREGVQ